MYLRIFKIKWNLREPDKESPKAKVNSNKSKKRKSEAISEKERKVNISKKGQSDENLLPHYIQKLETTSLNFKAF